MFKKLLLATTGLFLLSTGVAEAAPLVGGISALVGSIGAGVSLGQIVLGIASMGAQWLLSMVMAPEQKQRGIKTKMETGGDKPPTFIVGEYATSGHLIYANVLNVGGTNIPNALLVYVIMLSAFPVQSVSNEVFISNERCHVDTESSWPGGFMEVNEYVKGGDDGGYCLMKFHLGDQTNADSWLKDKFGSDPDRPWTDDMFLPGCAYAIVQCHYSNRGIWTGLPEFRFQVQGAKLYDPRKDSTQPGGSGSHRWGNPNTYEYSANPKVIEYNVTRGFYWDDKWQWGGKAEAYRLPLDYWFAAMNACDENVNRKSGGTVKRYRMGAEISFDDKPLDIVNEINKSCSGYTTEFGGTYKTWVGGPGLSIGTITDDDFLITAEMETNPFQPMQATVNTCYATYPEPKQMWEVKDGPRYQDADALAEDNDEELSIDLPLPFVSENNQVQRLMRAAVKDGRRQLTHSGQLPPVAWLYEPFDRLNYQSDMFGYGGSGKGFIVSTKDDLPNVNQQVLLREINPDDTGWLSAYEQDYDYAPLVVVKPDALALDVTATADQVEGASGKDRPAILAEWDWAGADIDVRHIDWRIRRAGTTKVVANGKIKRVEDGSAIVVSNILRFGASYEIQFRPEPFAIRESGWTDWKSVTMLSVDVPVWAGTPLTAISDLGADGKLDFYVKANWVDSSQNVVGYGVKVTIGGDTNYYKADGSQFKFPVKAPATVDVAVRARASDGGTPSAWSTTETISVTKKGTAPTTPTQLTVTGRHRHAVVETEDHPDADFKRWCVYYSKTNNFATATKTKHSKSNRFVIGNLDNGDTYYFWLTAEDASGNESAKYPTSNTGGVSATMAKIDDDDTESTTLAAPSGLTLTKVQNTDDDGSVRTFIKMECTAPAWATSKTTYVFAVTDGTDTTTVKSDDTVARFRVQTTGVLHTVKVRAIKGHGNKGAWSSDVTITPSKKLTLPTAVTGLTIVTKAQKNVIKWTKSSDADYLETAILRSTTNNVNTATEIGRISGNRFVDDEITKGTTYYYWGINYNRSAAVASASSSANGMAKGVEYTDADNLVLSAPTGVSLTQANKDVDLDGTVDIALLATFSSGTSGAIDYEFELSRSTSSGGTYTVIETRSSPSGKVWFKANTQYWYKTRVRAIAWDGTLGTWSSLTSAVQPAGTTGAPSSPTGYSVSAQILGFGVQWTAPTELDYFFTEIGVGGTTSPATIVGTSTGTSYFNNFSAGGFAFKIWLRHVNTSMLRSSWVEAGSVTADKVGSTEIEANAVGRTALASGAGGAVAVNNLGTSNSGSVNAGSAAATLLTLTFKCTSNTSGVTINLGGQSWTVDFTNNLPFTFTTAENGGGSFSFSKSGGGTQAGVQLTATGLY